MLCYNRRIPIPELEARIDVSGTIGSCVKGSLLQKLKICSLNVALSLKIPTIRTALLPESYA
jgi:hypothetical protein